MPDQPFIPAERPDHQAMEAQFRAAREAAERQFRTYRRQIADELSSNVESAFTSLGAVSANDSSLGTVSVPDLHRLEQADSHVRHSIVQASFYNLRLYSGLLLDRRHKPGFREKLESNLNHLPGIREELERYFAVRMGTAAAGVFFPREQASALDELGRLSVLAADLIDRFDDQVYLREFAKRAPEHIDRIMGALGRITARLREIKVDLVGLLEEVVALHGDRLAAAGVSLRFTNKNGEAAPLFGHRRDLMNVFNELVTNASRHGLAALPAGKPRVIGIVLRMVTLGQQTYQVDVADSGRGIPQAVKPHLGVPGVTSGGTGFGLSMVRRIIEADHLGTLAVLSREGTGTLVRIHLPKTLAGPI